ncbi:MAG TPA: type IV pilus twitching motility protein PilT [Candidatus Eisenbacteria bacterium]|nr:type IV pilus twitching motility protein PilT [Candidatus Eisenbacteria bacterium]
MNRIDAFLELAVNQGGSDLHLVSGQPPRIRLNGELQGVRFRELSTQDVHDFLDEFMTPEQRQVLAEHRSVDFAYASANAGRFRVNVYRHVGGVAAAMRVIPTKVPSLDALGLPQAVHQVLGVGKGLVLVTGPTGSGKSTTLAGMVDHLNHTLKGHVITIEDPIEFVHEYDHCVVTQREVGAHAATFAEALRSAVREDPDVILVGEMRDLETISLALTAAETGIMVFGTLHTNGAVRCVDRIVNVFPPRRQDQVRTMLADSLRLVVSQQLVRKADHSGRIVAAEVMVNTHAVSSMIRQGNMHKLGSAIQAGQRVGMQSLDAVLTDYVRRELITGEEAYEHAVDRTVFERFVTTDLAA